MVSSPFFPLQGVEDEGDGKVKQGGAIEGEEQVPAAGFGPGALEDHWVPYLSYPCKQHRVLRLSIQEASSITVHPSTLSFPWSCQCLTSFLWGLGPGVSAEFGPGVGPLKGIVCGIWGVPATVSEDVTAAVACPVGSSWVLPLSVRCVPFSGTGLGDPSSCRWSSISETVLSPGLSISAPLGPGSRTDNLVSLFLRRRDRYCFTCTDGS